LMVECHFEQIFVNLGYEKCAAFNSLITGCGVDICCTYLFVYKWEWGMTGVALAQLSVKSSRILVWLVFIYWFNLGKYFYGCKKKVDITNITSNNRPLLPVSETDGKTGDETGGDPLFSWDEFYLFLRTVIPTILTYFSDWLIFELQIICLAHIANIPRSAVAAGSIWIQTESTLAAVQTGWLKVTRMNAHIKTNG